MNISLILIKSKFAKDIKEAENIIKQNTVYIDGELVESDYNHKIHLDGKIHIMVNGKIKTLHTDV